MKAFITMALMTVGLMLGSFPGQAQGSKPLHAGPILHVWGTTGTAAEHWVARPVRQPTWHRTDSSGTVL
jgi:hypothetical protein